MSVFLPTIILRHRRENLKKCSLRGLESRDDLRFYTYPKPFSCDLTHYITLSLEGPELTEKDAEFGLFLIDGTWAHAKVMHEQVLKGKNIHLRSLPKWITTAYPRKQTGCLDPQRGLASVEALYCAHSILKRNTEGLLDHYYWKEQFLSQFNSNKLS